MMERMQATNEPKASRNPRLELPFRAFEFHGYVSVRHSVKVKFPDELMERARQFRIQRSLLKSAHAPC